MFNAIRVTTIFLATFFNSYEKLKIVEPSQKVLSTKLYNKCWSKNFRLPLIQRTSHFIQKISFKRKKVHITDFPIEILDIIFSYTLENILDEKDMNYAHIFYTNKSFFQKNIVHFVHKYKLFSGIYHYLECPNVNNNVLFDKFFPLFATQYHPCFIKKQCITINVELKKFESWPPSYLKNIDTSKPLLDKANDLLTKNITSEDGYTKKPLNDEEAKKFISRIFIDSCNPNVHDSWSKIDFITIIDKVIASYITFYTTLKDTFLREILMQQIVYRSCTRTLLGIQLLMLIQKRLLNQSNNMVDLAVENLFTLTYEIHLDWLSKHFNFVINAESKNNISKIIQNIYTANFLSNFIYESLFFHVTNGFLDLNHNGINIEFFINAMPIAGYCTGFFLNQALYSPTVILLNILREKRFESVEEIIVKNIDPIILTQVETLKNRKGLKIIVEKMPEFYLPVQENSYYHIIPMQSIFERIRNLSSTNVTVGLKNFIVSINPINISIEEILFLEKHIFYLNNLFLKKTTFFDRQNRLDQKINSFASFINKNITIDVMNFFTAKNSLLDQWYKITGEHKQALPKNLLTLPNISENGISVLPNFTSLSYNYDKNTDEKIVKLISKNNLIHTKKLFFILKKKYEIYEKESESIKKLYIKWASEKIPRHKYSLTKTEHFIYLLADITKFIKNDFSELIKNHSDVFDETIMNNINEQIQKNNFKLKDFENAIILNETINKNLPGLYKAWGIAQGFFDKDYKGPQEHFSHWALWFSIKRDIKLSMLKCIKNAHPKNSPWKEFDNDAYNKIDESDSVLLKDLKTYNKWKSKTSSI